MNINKPKPILRLLAKVPGGFSLFINPLYRKRTGVFVSKIRGSYFNIEISDYTQRKAWLGAFEELEISFIERALSPGDVAVDVGANVGFLSVPMAKAIGNTGRLISIEAIPETALQLSNNLKLNSINWSTVINTAVGDSEGTLEMSNEHNSKDTSSGFYRIAVDSDKSTVSIPVTRLDNLLGSLELTSNIKLLKVDVEGMEPKVISGLGALLNPSLIRYIMFEVFLNSKGISETGLEVIQQLTNSGFALYQVKKKGKLVKISDLSKLTSFLPNAINLIATTEST